MRTKPIIVTLCIAAFLWGCSADQDLKPVRDNLLVAQSLPSHARHTYANLKGIPKHAESTISQSFNLFSHETALVDYLLKNDYADDLEVNLKLLEQRNKALLRLHYKRIVDERLTEQAIRLYYDENASEFGDRIVNVAALKFRATPNMSEKQRAERKQLAERVAADISSGIVTFEQAYASYNGGKAPQGVRLGQVQGLTPALLEMGKGDVSSVMEVDEGFVIYQLLGDPTTQMKPYEAVRDQIGYQLKQQYRLDEEERLQRLINKRS